MILRALSVIIFFTVGAAADDGVRFYVFEEITTETLRYDHGIDMTVYDFTDPSPRLVFSTEYRVYGCRLPKFSYTTQRFEVDITRKQLQQLRTSLASVDTKLLDSKRRRNEKGDRASGWLDMDGQQYFISLPVKSNEYASLHKRVMTFLDSIVPPAKRKTSKVELEGETVAAQEVTFATLLKSPEKFDQRRIRLRGYWHVEFEGSNFGPRKGADYKESIWLGGASTFADPNQIQKINDTNIVVEGTFEKGPGGHMGLWPGELNRLTFLQKIKP